MYKRNHHFLKQGRIIQVLLLLLVLKQSVDGICQTNLTNITVIVSTVTTEHVDPAGSMMTHRNDLICPSYRLNSQY